MLEQQWQVKPENRERFEKVVIGWGTLIQIMGWDDLCDMYVRRVPPFNDVPELFGKNKHKQAKNIILGTIAYEMKQAGLEIHNEKNV